jgi:hypothetical protein
MAFTGNFGIYQYLDERRCIGEKVIWVSFCQQQGVQAGGQMKDTILGTSEQTAEQAA